MALRLLNFSVIVAGCALLAKSSSAPFLARDADRVGSKLARANDSGTRHADLHVDHHSLVFFSSAQWLGPGKLLR